MPDVGDRETARLEVTPFDGTTLATLVVVLDGNDEAEEGIPPATSQDGGASWQTSWTYTAPGLWYLDWTVTGTGAGFQRQVVSVAPALTAARRSYATTGELAGYLGEAAPLDARRLLGEATVLIDRILLTSRYDVDVDGLPTDAAQLQALKDATCELVKWWGETGDETGAGASFASASIGGVSLGRGGSGGGTPNPRAPAARVGPQVLAILDLAGLTGHAPWQAS